MFRYLIVLSLILGVACVYAADSWDVLVLQPLVEGSRGRPMIRRGAEFVDDESAGLDTVRLKVKRQPKIQVVGWDAVVAYKRVSES